MRIALLLLLTGCGVVEDVEEVREELPTVAATPNGLEVGEIVFTPNEYSRCFCRPAGGTP